MADRRKRGAANAREWARRKNELSVRPEGANVRLGRGAGSDAHRMGRFGGGLRAVWRIEAKSA